MRARWLVVVWLLGACARPAPSPPTLAPAAVPDEIVVLLPGPGGAPGKIRVTVADQARTLETPYAAARLSPGRRLDREQMTAATVQVIFGEALLALPARPKAFVVYFAFGTDTLTESSTHTVQQILDEIANHAVPEIVVIGHTDRVGTDRENDTLSIQRAERVRQDLIQRGIAPEVIETVGRGERDATGDAARDRRVDIVVR